MDEDAEEGVVDGVSISALPPPIGTSRLTNSGRRGEDAADDGAIDRCASSPSPSSSSISESAEGGGQWGRDLQGRGEMRMEWGWPVMARSSSSQSSVEVRLGSVGMEEGVEGVEGKG